MITRQQLTQYTNQLLQVDSFNDYCPNGLQVQGRDEINTIVSGVTASHALITAAIEKRADAIFVHHGYFWKGEDPCLIGMKAKRIGELFRYDVNLFAYHLPLDGHQELGNNAALAEKLNITAMHELATGDKPAIAFQGELNTSLSGEDFADHISRTLNRKPLHIAGTQRPIKRVAWCTGGAQNFIEHAAKAHCDAYISGEVSEQTFHFAMENDIHYFAAGHHATERYGIQALCEHLAERFELQHHFIDIDNPV